MEFWTSLIKTKEDNESLRANCTHVTGEYWIFEGDLDFLGVRPSRYTVVAEGAVPCLGDLSEQELIAGCLEWYGVDLKKQTKTPPEAAAPPPGRG